MKQYLTTVAGALVLAVSSQATAGGLVNSAVNDWTGGAVMCEIVHQILENEMDFKVKRIVMPSGPGRDEAIRAGDLDYGCELWPSYSTTIQKYVSEYGGDGSMLKVADAGVIGVSLSLIHISEPTRPY